MPDDNLADVPDDPSADDPAENPAENPAGGADSRLPQRDPAEMSVDHLTQAFASLLGDEAETDEFGIVGVAGEGDVTADPFLAENERTDNPAPTDRASHSDQLPESSKVPPVLAIPKQSPSTEQHDGSRGEDESPVTPAAIVEAILFVGHPENIAISSRLMASYLRGVSPQEVDELVVQLNEQYAQEKTAYEIASEGAGYRLVLRDEYARIREAFYGRVREAKLSQAAVDLLALVAYRQPITRDQLEKLRGQPSGGVLGQLVRRQLLEIEYSEGKPRQKTYRTTSRFLDLFGLDSLEDLPRHEEV